LYYYACPLKNDREDVMEILMVVGMAACIACMAMMGGMALGGLRRMLRRRDES
jgi:hypothetical protein